jgi:hypothetical protein
MTPPNEMFLADQPDLTIQFVEWAPFLLSADVTWLPAAMAAGVRPLSQAVIVVVVDGDEAVINTAVQKRIAARYLLFERLLRAETAGDHTLQVDMLHKIKVMALPNLRIQTQLRLGSQIKMADAEPFMAKWVNGVLYLDSERQPIPWTAVARELAQAIASGRNVSGLALGIKEVLVAKSAADAATVLDELGYP